METFIIPIFMILAFYIIGAYATTDILRLLKGVQQPVWEKSCYCPHCGNKISLYDQIPIFSYILGHGECRYCKNKIPFSNLFLEIVLFAVMSAVTLLFHFSWTSYTLCLVLYEGTKVIYILSNGCREERRMKNIAASIMSNFIVFFLLAVLFFINQIIR